MRKLALTFLAVFIITTAGILVYADQLPAEYKFDITSEESLTLDFSGSTVSVEGWDENYVLVKQKEKLTVNKKDFSKLMDRDFSIVRNGSTIALQNYTPFSVITYKLQTWLPLIQFDKYKKDFTGSTGLISTGVIDIGISSSTVDSQSLMIFDVKVPKNLPVKIKALSYTATNYTRYRG